MLDLYLCIYNIVILLLKYREMGLLKVKDYVNKKDVEEYIYIYIYDSYLYMI